MALPKSEIASRNLLAATNFCEIPFIACRGTLCNLNFVNRLVTLCAIYIIETKRLETFYNQI